MAYAKLVWHIEVNKLYVYLHMIGKFIPPKFFGNPINPYSGSCKFPSVRMISNLLLSILGKDETPSAPMHLVTQNIFSHLRIKSHIPISCLFLCYYCG